MGGCGCGGSQGATGSEDRVTTAPDSSIGPGALDYYWDGPVQAPKEGEVTERISGDETVETDAVVVEEPVVVEPAVEKPARAKSRSSAKKKTG